MIWRPSGGLLYHWRARRNRARWSPFVASIQTWLEDWNPPARTLVLIGPSGGYTLPTAWLKRFSQIEAYDLDPLAPWFFRRQHPDLSVTFYRQNVFAIGDRLDIRSLDNILRLHPRATILFSNVIGQVLLEIRADESDWYAYLVQLRARLAKFSWASYHDLRSIEGPVAIDHLTTGPWTDHLPRTFFEWSLSSRRRHEVEGVTHLARPQPKTKTSPE